MKKGIITLLAPLLCLSGAAQQLISKGSFEYSFSKSFNNNYSVNQEPVKENISYRFSESILRTEKKLGDNITLTSLKYCEGDSGVCYLNNGIKFYSYNEIRESFFAMTGYSAYDVKYEYLADTTTINGLLCKKVLVHTLYQNEIHAFELWYCPDYKIANSCISNFFEKLNGIPVRFRYTRSLSGGYTDVELVSYSLNSNNEISEIENLKSYQRISQENKIQVALELKGMQVIRNENKSLTAHAPEENITMNIAMPSLLEANKRLPDFQGFTVENKIKQLSDYKGKLLVLNFWFSNCAPCITEMPLLNKIASDYHGKNIDFVAITYNSVNEVRSFLNNRRFIFEHIVGAQDIVDEMKITSYPTTVVVDENGIIRFITSSALSNARELSTVIDKLLVERK